LEFGRLGSVKKSAQNSDSAVAEFWSSGKFFDPVSGWIEKLVKNRLVFSVFVKTGEISLVSSVFGKLPDKF
jgi:hypothetical protein